MILHLLALSSVIVSVLDSNKTSLKKYQFGCCYLDSATKVKNTMIDVFTMKIKIKLEPWNIRVTSTLFFKNMIKLSIFYFEYDKIKERVMICPRQ